jgi:hypothetical protein
MPLLRPSLLLVCLLLALPILGVLGAWFALDAVDAGLCAPPGHQTLSASG